MWYYALKYFRAIFNGGRRETGSYLMLLPKSLYLLIMEVEQRVSQNGRTELFPLVYIPSL